MTGYSRIAAASTLASALAFAFASAGVDAQAPLLVSQGGYSVIASRTETGAGLRIVASADGSGLPTFANAEQAGILLGVGEDAPAASRAASFVATYGAAFGITRAADARLVSASGPDAVGLEHVRYRQTVEGIPVTGGEMIVHLRGARVVAVNATTQPTAGVSITPTVTAEHALAEAHALMAKREPVAAGTAKYAARLELFNTGMFDDRPAPTRLAWFVQADASAIGVHEYIWIDAASGAVLLAFNQTPDAQSRSIYTANNTGAIPGTLVRSEGGPASTDSEVNRAYDYAADFYDFWFSAFGLDSYDNRGGPLIATTNYCPTISCPYPNSFWSGTQVVLGTGYAAQDIVGHEFTHGIIQNSANFYTYQQPGALSEAFADIFGETIDLLYPGDTDSDFNQIPPVSIDWQIGEDLPGGYIRNLFDPGTRNDPARMNDGRWLCSQYTDNGGVHHNGTILGVSYVLMVLGGTFNGQTITQIGATDGEALEAAARIFYRALTVYLTSGATFRDAAFALNQSCSDLTGQYGITPTACVNVSRAITAVEMTSRLPCSGTADTPAACAAGQVPANVFFDNFETSMANWSINTITGGTHWSSTPVTGNAANGGVRSAFAANIGSVGDSALEMRSTITLPASAYLQFKHSFSFETSRVAPVVNYDGGLIEYSLDGGQTWLDGGGLASAGGLGYNGRRIDSNTGNPLNGRFAFTQTSYGYATTQVNLANLAGQRFKLRFRAGTDASTSDLGWYLDDVRIYTCARAQRLLVIDTPRSGDTVGQPFTMAGWALDQAATVGAGLDVIHVYAYPNPGSGAPPVFVGAATLGLPRPDISALFGPQFGNAGWSISIRGLTAGPYQLVAYGHSTSTGLFDVVNTVTVTAQQSTRIVIDTPGNNTTVSQPFFVAGWALDASGAPGTTGVDAVNVYAFSRATGLPTFLGSNYGNPRGDVGAAFGSQFTNSGFAVAAFGLSAGVYDIVAYAHNASSGAFIPQVVTVTVQGTSGASMVIDIPAGGTTVARPFTIAGWALDGSAAAGTGVDTIHVWAYPAGGGSPVFVGVATYGATRPDVGALFGSRFTDSGFSLSITSSLLPLAGTYDLVAFAHSTATGTFNNSRVVRVTVN